MLRDPIVEDVRAIRKLTEEACQNDWDKLIQHYRGVKVPGGKLVRRSQKNQSRDKSAKVPKHA